MISSTSFPAFEFLIPSILTDVVFFLYKSGESMLDASTRPYIVNVVCKRDFPANKTLCTDLDKYPEIEDQVQIEAGKYLIFYRVLVNFPAIFLGLFCGAWSDKYGRKIPMILPSLGSIFSILFYIISLSSTNNAVAFVFLGAFIQGSFGKSSLITMAVNSYATDITCEDDRTRKLGKLLAMNFFGLFVGALFSGIFQDISDLQTAFCAVIFVHASVVLIIITAMPETVSNPVARDERLQTEKSECCATLGYIRESMYVMTRERANRGRTVILILFLISLMNQTCKVGETDITLLFVTRRPLNWPKSWYGYLLSVDYAVMGICLIVVLPILSNVLLVPDAAIVIIGLVCKIIRLLWAGFIQESWMVYVSVVIGSFSGMITSSIRSLVSKAADENEHGKVFSLLASIETISKPLGTLIFVSMYGATAYFFPGFTYIIEAILYMVMTVIVVLNFRVMNMIGAASKDTSTEDEHSTQNSELTAFVSYGKVNNNAAAADDDDGLE
ncbi:solute carrier family 46 member 3-like [Dreissena polymorpha]|uniref:Proton-coupled folate transporter n=1 Tax=Dreissena polymorpha TaxID=45954 RepID=A0A9D4NCE8_DREPO|nr:solute carrier family 46 member 3-like [Dreissena polymorpha]KAH3891835.1 hypothetical protein DPMN_015943 [Dreissena polymorpha]